MAHFKVTSGVHLAKLITTLRPEWGILKQRSRRILIQNKKDVTDIRGFSTQQPMTLKQVRALCKSFNISAEEFEQGLRAVLAAETYPKSDRVQ